MPSSGVETKPSLPQAIFCGADTVLKGTEVAQKSTKFGIFTDFDLQILIALVAVPSVST